MLFVLLLLPLVLLLSFWGKLLLLPFTPSIGVLLPLFIIKLLMIYCLVLLPPMTYLESLDVSVLFFFKIMKETNFSLVLVCVVFLGMELIKKVIGVMIPLENVFVFLGMWSFGNTKCFTNYHMFLFHLFPLSILSLTFFPKESPTSPFESPPYITSVPSHASDELPAPIIDVPTHTALTVDPAGPFDSCTSPFPSGNYSSFSPSRLLLLFCSCLSLGTSDMRLPLTLMEANYERRVGCTT